MKSKNKFVIIALIVLLVIASISGGFYFFGSGSKVEGVATLTEMSVPQETQNLKISLDSVKIVKIKKSNLLLIKGWILQDNIKDSNRELFLVLTSTTDTLVFNIENDQLPRPDVARYYQIDSTIQNLGYKVLVPLTALTENKYKAGFILVDASGKYFSQAPKILTIAGETVSVETLQVAGKPKSNLVNLPVKAPTSKSKHGLDDIKVEANSVSISGWGFIQGINADNLKAYIILRKDNKSQVFATAKRVRPDVSKVYKSTGLSYDSCGFFLQVPKSELQPGKYEVGIYMVKGDQIGVVYPRKFFDIGN